MSEAYTLMHVPVRLVETIQGIASGALVAVPREPTMAMLRAGVHGEPGFYTHSNTAALMGAWRRMLAAAQEAGHE